MSALKTIRSPQRERIVITMTLFSYGTIISGILSEAYHISHYIWLTLNSLFLSYYHSSPKGKEYFNIHVLLSINFVREYYMIKIFKAYNFLSLPICNYKIVNVSSE